MPYQQVFELQEPDSFHGSKIVDQSINLGVKGVPGSLTAELFPSVFALPTTSLSVTELTLTKGPASSNRVIIFPEGYSIYADNTGVGADASRLWVDTPDLGEVVIGPRTSASYLQSLRLRARGIQFDWENAGGNAAAITLPSGLIYDHGRVNFSGATVGAWPANLFNTSVSTPPNHSVSIYVWIWVRVDQVPHQVFTALDCTIGGSLQTNPALAEQTTSTGADGTGSTGAGGTGSTGGTVVAAHDIIHGGADQVWDVATASHVTGSHQGESHASHSHTGPSHTHTGPSHSHTILPTWKLLAYNSSRNYTPTTSSQTLQVRAGTQDGSSQAYDDGHLIYLVVVN